MIALLVGLPLIVLLGWVVYQTAVVADEVRKEQYKHDADEWSNRYPEEKEDV